ncbi:UDP-glycosyltransferase 43 [Ziziphus jujuba]|uniref:Glycosyltransferase n=1 Tax=Ziziphus jujuba TaxID=326968 RepID=A0A6P3ZB04_ZIZJJ|nr:UDP-glycosyltransferase 43 [Ziziphus jujuba]
MTTNHSHHHTDQLQLVFLSTPAIGNLVPTVEFARHLLNHHPQFSATILLINEDHRPIVNIYSQSISATAPNIRFIHLPPVYPPSPDQFYSSLGYVSLLINNHKPQVKNAIANLIGTHSSPKSPSRVAALFVDMFCTPMIDVANELGVPCYLFFQSPASFFGFMIDLPDLDPKLVTGFSDSDTEFSIRSFRNPVPKNLLPNTVLKGKDGYSWYVHHGRRYMEAKGIVVNTFRELESYAIDSLSSGGVPKVYPIGPVIDLNGPSLWHPDRAHYETVAKWLDGQPKSSVVFLCFGSMGSLSGKQVREIAVGLERAGFRFLWSLREPPKTQLDLPSDYVDVSEAALPNGFLERTAGMGLVCGWVPQVTILAHQAIGGFVSHCGWNSILESLWYGVPIATWPIYAEQQLNAFEMVKELGLAVELRLDYREGRHNLIPAEEVERGIKRLMKDDERVREKVKEMREKSRMTLMDNGSSSVSLGALVKDLMSDN